MKYFVESDSSSVLYWNMRNYKLFTKGNLHFYGFYRNQNERMAG